MSGGIQLLGRGGRPEEVRRRIARRQVEQDKGERHDTEDDGDGTQQVEGDPAKHRVNVDLGVRGYLLSLLAALVLACGPVAERRGATVIFASGADLQSANPLVTTHPLARQVQRYVLLTTLVRYDSLLQVEPFLAREWTWSADHRVLTLRIRNDVSWHDGVRTTAHDAAWTLNTARDPATGYPRASDLADLQLVSAPDDSTLILHFSEARPAVPDVLTDLAILPRHLLDSIPHDRLRQAPWNEHPVGNGPFRFVEHESNRRWVFEANPDFPRSLGGRPRLDRLVIAVVDEPTTKLAALTSGELDFAGIQPAHASFVERDPRLAVVTYPLLLTYTIVFNTRHPPFDDVKVRRAVALALDRREIVDGFLFGFGTPAIGPLPPPLGPAAADSAIAPDLAMARQLLNGRSVEFEMLTVGSGEAALEQMIQSQLARAGMRVTIRQLELTAFLDRVQGAQHDFSAAVMGTSGDLGLGHLVPLLATAGVHSSSDRDAMLQIFADSAPVAFLYHARGVQGMNRRIHGVHMDMRGELASLSGWWVDR